MPRKYRIFGLSCLAFLMFFVLSVRPNSVQASSIVEPVVHSNYLPVPTYTNPNCTKPTGEKLSTKTNVWYYTKMNKDQTAYRLGPRKWVKSTDVFTYLDPATNEVAYKLTKRKVPVYNGPQMWHRTGTLKKSVKVWHITRVTNNSVDLGNNQWVSRKRLAVVDNPSYFKPHTRTHDHKGHYTGTLAQTETPYKILDAKMIHGKTYVRIGDQRQWVNYNAQQQNY